MKVSIIIPLYNKAPYVTRTLESVKAQTFTDYECIIINDGSTDNSAQIVEDWISSHFATSPSSPSDHFAASPSSPFRLITQANAGVSAARNKGIALAQGDYLAFLDADDWWEPTFLEEMVKLTEEYPDAGIYASNYIYYKPGKTRVGVRQVYGVECMVYSEEGWSGYINYPKSYYENGEQVVWTGAVMLCRSILEKPEIRNEKGEIFSTGIKLGEDFLLWLRLSLSYPVAFLNKPLAYYNNELSGSLRLTGKLHKPEENMLWHMDYILDSFLKSVVVDVDVVVNTTDWKKLFDRLRVNGLYPYWLSHQYHKLAEAELSNVNWNMIDNKNLKLYRYPLFISRVIFKSRYVCSRILSLLGQL